MREEFLQKETKSVCVNFTAGKVDSLRMKTKRTSTVRVYDNAVIGVAGKVGEADKEALKKEAVANLSRWIPYPDLPEKPVNKSINAKKTIVSDSDFMPFVKLAAERIANENPMFNVNGKAYLSESDSVYIGSDGTNLSYSGNAFSFELEIKEKKSANIMDMGFGIEDDKFLTEDFYRDVKTRLDAYLIALPHFEKTKIPVIMSEMYFTYMLRHFVADVYCNNVSLLNGKLGEKVFNDKLNVLLDRNPDDNLNIEFFDDEGVINEDYKAYLVKNGVMENLLTTKITAKKYGVKNIGSAYADFADVPTISARGFAVGHTNENLADILGDEEAVYLDVSSGGDMTPDGDITLPSQLAYLYRGGKIVGKLPEFSLKGNVFDMFGKDFLGACSLGSLFKSFKRENVVVAYMDVVNKK